jgi:hypothetical protein
MNVKKSGGINITMVLLIVFVVLKLTKNIDWNWLWVLSPILIPLTIVVVAGVLLGIVNLILIGLGIQKIENFFEKNENDDERK